MNRESGFTLVEVLISVAIIGMLTAISLPVSELFVRRNDLDIAAQNLVSTLRRAQTYARSVNHDSDWSVKVQQSSVTLFRGTNFGSRNTDYDETFNLVGTITPTGLAEVQFTKLNATPNTAGTITLSSTTNDIRTITINAKGAVTY